VTILDDEDYRILMAMSSGLEAFGVFVAMLILGRERLQQGKAQQVPETESLKFDNSTTHLLAMTHLTRRQLDRCLNTLAEVAKDSQSEPWMYLDSESQLVIRSFFKFNTQTGWGGSRAGAGRRSNLSQDDSKKNHLDSHKESSWSLSGTGTGTGTVRTTGAREPFDPTDPAGPEPPCKPFDGCAEAIEQARRSFGDELANAVKIERKDIDRQISSRWDYLKGAFLRLEYDLSRPNAKAIENPLGAAIFHAKKWAVAGAMPPLPVAARPKKTPEPPLKYVVVTHEEEAEYEAAMERTRLANIAKKKARGDRIAQ
jgi:hypothetical protein